MNILFAIWISMCDKIRNTWLGVHWQWNTLDWCQLNALQASPVVHFVTPLSCVSLSMNTQPSVPTIILDNDIQACIKIHWGWDRIAPFCRQHIEMHFLEWKCMDFAKISLKFVPKVQINNMLAFVQIMAWRRPGDKPLSEQILVNLLTHICITRPQWINPRRNSYPNIKYICQTICNSMFNKLFTLHPSIAFLQCSAIITWSTFPQILTEDTS